MARLGVETAGRAFSSINTTMFAIFCERYSLQSPWELVGRSAWSARIGSRALVMTVMTRVGKGSKGSAYLAAFSLIFGESWCFASYCAVLEVSISPLHKFVTAMAMSPAPLGTPMLHRSSGAGDVSVSDLAVVPRCSSVAGCAAPCDLFFAPPCFAGGAAHPFAALS